eukprot:gene12661-16869_t
MMSDTLPNSHPPVVGAEQWEAARAALLVKEKAHTRARDALAAERRRMPWMAIEKPYAFEGPDGAASLLDLPGCSAGPTTRVVGYSNAKAAIDNFTRWLAV